MLLASKSGDIAVAKLSSESPTEWVLEVEGAAVHVSKTDDRRRAFNKMSEALAWAGADERFVTMFVGLDAGEARACVNVVPRPKLKRDYRGKRVRLVRELRNGLGVIKAGSVGIIDHQSPKGSSITFDACSCCGFRPTISHVKVDDIEFIELRDCREP